MTNPTPRPDAELMQAPEPAWRARLEALKVGDEALELDSRSIDPDELARRMREVLEDVERRRRP